MLIAERKAIRYSKRRTAEKAILEKYNEKASLIAGRLSKIRLELKLAKLILERSEEVKAKFAQIKEDEKKKEDTISHNHEKSSLRRQKPYYHG